jgi:hypothetical protein
MYCPFFAAPMVENVKAVAIIGDIDVVALSLCSME